MNILMVHGDMFYFSEDILFFVNNPAVL